MSRSSITLSIATWIRSARSGSSLIATMPRWLRGIRPKWMVSGSPSERPSATFIGSTSPIRSATLVSGVASFSAYRSSRCRHSTGRSSPSSAARRFDSWVIGSYGCSPSSAPAITGVHSSSRPTIVRSSRVLPWPRSPSSTTSWPAIRARSSCGMTVSSKPCSPGHGSRPSRSAASRLSRISSRRVSGHVAGGAQLADGRRLGCGGSRSHSLTLLSRPTTGHVSVIGARVAGVPARDSVLPVRLGRARTTRAAAGCTAAPPRRRRAEELMRSRYAAYAVGDPDYVWRTWHPRTRPDVLEPDPALTWTGLDRSLERRATDWVEFVASYDRARQRRASARAEPVRAAAAVGGSTSTRRRGSALRARRRC